MKLLLLSCRSPFLDSDRIYPPLANLYLYSMLKDISVTIIDDYNLNDPSWIEPYTHIGVSIMTPQRAEATRILEFIKKYYPDKKVIAGGPHVKHYLSDVINEDWDYIVPFDGERALRWIIDGKSDRVVRDSISIKEYPEVAVKPNRLDNSEFLSQFDYVLNSRRSTTMITSRGCPERCTFCEDAMTWVRWTPFHLILEELDDIVELGYGGVYIFDDIFALSMKKVRPICDALLKRGLIYRCNGQARLFSQEFAQMLSETGCVEIAFGAESGSQQILDTVQKRTTTQMNYRFVEWCKEFGIVCKAFLMIGLPGETHQTIADTETFIRESGIDDFQLAIYYPYRGTQIRDSLDRGESVDLFFEGEGLGAYAQSGGNTESVVRTTDLSACDLIEERDRIVKLYKPKAHTNKWKDSFFDIHLNDFNSRTHS